MSEAVCNGLIVAIVNTKAHIGYLLWHTEWSSKTEVVYKFDFDQMKNNQEDIEFLDGNKYLNKNQAKIVIIFNRRIHRFVHIICRPLLHVLW